MNYTCRCAFCLSLLLTCSGPLYAGQDYGRALCNDPDYHCIKIHNGDTWSSLWPNETEQDIVQRVNRKNTSLWAGMVLAVPENLATATWMDFSPMPRSIPAEGEKVIIVDQSVLAWGAYDTDGQLVRWGPISSGQDYCPDVGRGCRTTPGTYRIFDKRGEECVSKIFPVGVGGAKMPYCMFFHGGYAMHGSSHVPGFRASHGCVRIFERDAQWLYYEFVQIPHNGRGTKVIIDEL